jgi:GGDEF domain-containing protein
MQMTWNRARGLVLLGGLIVVGVIVLVMSMRGVDPVEIAATMFFAPVFVGALYFGPLAGLLLGLAAVGGYVALRLPAIRLVGWSELGGLLAFRAAGYLLFGGVAGWASRSLAQTMTRLEAHDPVDPRSGLVNRRAVLHVLEAERVRAERYGSVFSVVALRMPDSQVPAFELGELVARRVRASDTAGRLEIDGDQLLVVVMPETPSEGAARLTADLTELISSRWRVEVSESRFTFPDDREELDRLSELLGADSTG